MNLRYTVFWALDKLKGNPLKHLLSYTQELLESENSEIVYLKNQKQLQRLLEHALNTTKFYNNKNFNELDDLPVTNKAIIRDHFESFLSIRYKTRELKGISTSGSTSAPFATFQNKEKVIKNNADNIYYSSKSNYKVGDFLVYLRIWPEKFSLKQKISFQTKNIQIQSVFHLEDHDINAMIEGLNKKKTKINFIGYASSFEKICRHLDTCVSNPIKFKSNSILAISEHLNDYTCHAMQKYFGVTPLSRYSNSENGIIAQQLSPDDHRLRINQSSYIIEILDLDSDTSLDYGQRGRIVITDLFNFAVPFIRYDTGDVGIIEKDNKGHLYFTEISGRKLDLLYDTKGNVLPSHLSAKLYKYGNFKQFQLVQKDKKLYQFYLNTIETIDEFSLINEFKKYFGEDSEIKISYVDDIPLLGSGKKREIINEYYT